MKDIHDEKEENPIQCFHIFNFFKYLMYVFPANVSMCRKPKSFQDVWRILYYALT